MKSLEIVDECLQQIKKSGECYIEDFELETIKYDLEVLEIVKKKKVYFQGLKYLVENIKSNEDVLCIYNFVRKEEEQLTMEELLKLKQWLEVNENV